MKSEAARVWMSDCDREASKRQEGYETRVQWNEERVRQAVDGWTSEC